MSSSMNQRFRNLVGSKRKPANTLGTSQSSNSLNSNAPTTNGSASTVQGVLGSSSSAPGNQSPGLPSPPIGSSAAAPLGQQQSVAAASSNTSLAMNPNQYPSARPPSYQHANSGAVNNLNPAPQQHMQGRPTSPMPPPINTGYGHMPPHQQQMYAQQQQQQAPQLGLGPPGYPLQQAGQQYGYQPPNMVGTPFHYNRSFADIEGAGQRSKAQLIVGIDFVSPPYSTLVQYDKGADS